jgi:hypothetical protein
LLFVFLGTSLPEDASDEETRRFHEGQGGHLRAIMCVDKDLHELSSFDDLVEESKQLKQDWQIVLIASLAGQNNVPPSAELAEEPLKQMVQTVQQGGDLSNYLALDRNGEPVTFGSQ